MVGHVHSPVQPEPVPSAEWAGISPASEFFGTPT